MLFNLMPIKNISKLLATAVAHCGTDDDISKEIVKSIEKHTDFFKGIGDSLDKSIPGFSLMTTIGKGLVKALTPEIMGGLVEKIEYSKIREYIIEPNPKEISNDLSKLLKKSAITALGYIKCLWFEKLKAEGDKEQIELLEGIFEQMKADMTSWLEYETIEETIISDPTDCLNAITAYIFTTSSVNRESAFADFFVDILPFCFKLSYREALKDDENQKAFKTFLFWNFETLNEKSDILILSQERIEEKLDKALKTSVPKFPQHLTRHPLVPEVFEGRKDELEKIKKALFEDENLLLLVNGEGGIGKTSLAAKYYQEYAHAYKYLAWILCEQSITEALLTLALPLKLQFNATATTDQRLNILLTQMANLDAPCLLVIDNANEVADLQQNYEHLRSCPNFHVLLTSRINKHKNAKLLKIDSLPREQALVVFREHYPKLQTHEEPIFEGIYVAVGGNTLVLELLAKNVALQNTLKTKYSLPDLLADLQTKGLLQIIEDDDVEVEYQNYRNAKPTEIIAAMYDLSKLSEAESRLLSVFAVLPAESILYNSIEQLLPNTQNLDKTILSLAQKGWLNHNTADNSFKCSPVIQEITRTKKQNLYADCMELIKKLIDRLAYDSNGTLTEVSFEEGLMFSHYAESLIDNFDKVEYDLALLCESLYNFYKTYGNIKKAVSYSEKGISIAETLLEQYPKNADYRWILARFCLYVGDLHKELGNLHKAWEYYEKRLTYSKELCRDFPKEISFINGLAVIYERLGNFERDLGYLNKALDYYIERHNILVELYIWKPFEIKYSLSISFQKLGDVQKLLGNLPKALEYFEKHNLIAEELYKNYPNEVNFKANLAVSYEKLGEIQGLLGEIKMALKYYEKRHKLSEELYLEYPNQIDIVFHFATSCIWLGDAQKNNNETDKAKNNLKIAVSLLEKLYEKESVPKYQQQLNSARIILAKLGE